MVDTAEKVGVKSHSTDFQCCSFSVRMSRFTAAEDSPSGHGRQEVLLSSGAPHVDTAMQRSTNGSSGLPEASPMDPAIRIERRFVELFETEGAIGNSISELISQLDEVKQVGLCISLQSQSCRADVLR